MIEVEAKIKIENPQETRNQIKAFGKFIKKELKIDNYYTLEPLSAYPKKSLRVRKKSKDYEINFKQRISYINGIHAKKESEFNVSDISNFLALIKDFGFHPWLKKTKVSETYQIFKNFTIELNQVKNLGWFLEIEYLVPSKSQIESARKSIEKIIEKLKIPYNDIIKEGYTKMLWDKRH